MAGHKETRVALIIGNSDYECAPRLKNPENDAQVISEAFGRLGFTDVRLRVNLGDDAFRQALQEFSQLTDDADMAVIYFAGHGIEVSRQNFLIPINAKLERLKDAANEAITLDQVLSSVDGARLLRLVILDACRDNPFRNRMLHANGTRSIGKGLRQAEPRGGVLVAYAAKHGTTAYDGDGKNSPYAEALLNHIERPLEISKLFREVRDDVLKRTGGRQEPHIYGSLGRKDIYLKYPDTFPIPNPKLWYMGAAAAGIAIAGLTAWYVTPSTQPSNPDRKPCDVHSQGPDAEPELRKLGCVPVKVSSASAVRELWIKAGGGREDDESFQDCWGEEKDKNRCGPRMVVIPTGTFQMGSPENESWRNDDEDDVAGGGGQRVPVAFKAPFAVAKFEISFAQWNSCLNDGGCKISAPRRNAETDDQPVVNVSWKDITDQYLPWLNTKVSGKADGPYRLLSEAEWEYAARAGTASPYWFGDSIGTKEASLDSSHTMPVNGLAANRWGLHHVHGNVWEWVQDRYLDSYKDMRSDGTYAQAPSQGTHVVRGGSFTNQPGDLRSAKRLSVPSYYRVRDIGFRVARGLEF